MRKTVKVEGPSAAVMEVAALDYTPITEAKPYDARASLALRPKRSGRKIRLLILVTAYNEAGDELQRTLGGVAANLKGLSARGLHWSEVQVGARGREGEASWRHEGRAAAATPPPCAPTHAPRLGP